MKTYNKYPRGSEWRKWDLHIHTPLSIEQHYGGEGKWDEFIESLEKLPSEVKVIGINDYYFIDGYERIMKDKQNGRLNNIEKIFPILEFRIDTFGSGNENNLQKINLHIVFDINENDLQNEINKIKREFIEQIPLTKLEKHKTKCLSKDNLTSEGGNNLKQGFSDLIPSTDKVFELIESITWRDKTFLLLGYKEWSNLEKNNQLKPFKEDLYKKVDAFFTSNLLTYSQSKNWLNEYGNKPLIHSLDIHKFDALDTIKDYHCGTWIKADPSFEGLKQLRYEPVDRIYINKSPSQPHEKTGYQVIDKIEISNPEFYNNLMDLNPNLNSIIGGRSTGKSILLGAIAKKLKTTRPFNFADEEYNKFVQSVANHIKITWKDKSVENSREIEYFQQGYMHEIARDENRLNDIIQNILKEKGKEEILDSYKKEIRTNSDKILEYLKKLHTTKSSIREKEGKVLDKGDKKGVEDEISKLEKELKELNVTEISDEDRSRYNILKNRKDEIEQIFQKIETDIKQISALKSIPLFTDNVLYEISSISEYSNSKIFNLFEEIKIRTIQEWNTQLDKIVLMLSKKVTKARDLIYNISSNEIFVHVSNAYNNNTYLSELEQKIKNQKSKLFEITNLLNEIEVLNKQWFDLYSNIKEGHQKFYEIINSVLSNLTESKDGLDIKATVKFDQKSYSEILYAGLNQKSDSHKAIANFDFTNNKEYNNHIFDLFDHLLNNELSLKGGYSNESLMERLLTANFYYLAYDLEYENDNFRRMSDGKKAFVILKLLLDFSEKDCPILIDQPEDDLDNRAIYTDLVQYLRNKKKKRQIIVATHNPNIVVGADSELVICANQHGTNCSNTDSKRFEYVSGSIEHTFEKNNKIIEILKAQGIRQHVCEILEGGDSAFKLRENKYSIRECM